MESHLTGAKSYIAEQRTASLSANRHLAQTSTAAVVVAGLQTGAFFFPFQSN